VQFGATEATGTCEEEHWKGRSCNGGTEVYVDFSMGAGLMTGQYSHRGRQAPEVLVESGFWEVQK
jgi:hypothetical protein